MGPERQVSSTAVVDVAEQPAAAPMAAPARPWPLPVAASTAFDGAALSNAGTEPSHAGPLARLRRMDPGRAAAAPAAAPDRVIRRIVPHGRRQFNRYMEEDDETLTKITKKTYDAMVDSDEDAAVTEESGYVSFKLEAGEKQAHWDIDDKVMEWSGKVLSAVRTFDLPVSCIEAAEHIVWQSGEDDAQDWHEDLADDKSVDVLMGSTRKRNTSVVAANVGTDNLTKKLPKHRSLNFDIYPLRVGEGIVAIDPDEPATSLHAVAVVAVNNGTRQFIVVERNAGKTSGSTNTLDSKWLLNVYNSAEAFRASMGPDYIVGKLRR